MTDSYKTIKGSASGEYKEKGSKFIALVFHVSGIEEVEKKLEEVRKKYHDARHHCYAYILGPEGKNVRANDDGEPSHSAGDPILGQLRSYNLTNVLAVVIRYFGGTKLGVGGLIHAYKTSADVALSKAKIIKHTVRVNFEISYSYDATNEIMRILDEFDIKIEDQQYAERCLILGRLKISQQKEMEKKIRLLQDLGNDVTLNIL